MNLNRGVPNPPRSTSLQIELGMSTKKFELKLKIMAKHLKIMAEHLDELADKLKAIDKEG